MTHSDIWNKLPQGWPVTSISSRITNIEELARETTAKMVVETLVNEGENALTQHNDPETLLAMLGQATTYLQTIEDRSPKYLEPSEESLETHFQKLDDQPFETLERAVLRHEAVLGTITEDPDGNDPESPVRQRTLDAFMLALSLALSAHVSALSKKTLLRDGHRQTTQGLFMNLETLAPEQVTLAPSVAEQRDTALRLRTKTAVDTATRQLMLKIPVITQLTPVEFHPSLDHDPKAHQQAKSIADETISNVGKRPPHAPRSLRPQPDGLDSLLLPRGQAPHQATQRRVPEGVFPRTGPQHHQPPDHAGVRTPRIPRPRLGPSTHHHPERTASGRLERQPYSVD